MANYASTTEYVVYQFVTQNNANPNRIADCYLYGPQKDRILVLAKNPERADRYAYLAGRSHFLRGGAVNIGAVLAVPAGYNGVVIDMPRLSGNDVVAISTATVDIVLTAPNVDVTVQAKPTGLPVFPDDAPAPIVAATGTATGTVTTGGAAATLGAASDRQLVVYENNPTNPDAGRLIAIPPGQATGVALPVFQVGTARPVAAATQGEAFYETSTRQGAVWDGAKWSDITPRAQILPWDATKSYGANELVTDRGMLWVTLQRAPIGSQPNAPSTIWKLLGSTGLVKITSLCDATNGIDKVPKVAGALALDSSTGQIYAYDGVQWVEQLGGYYGSDTPPALEASNVRFNQLDTPTWGAIPDLQAAIKKVYDEILASGTAASAPVIGEVKMFATTTIPTGWQLCDGSAIAAGKTAAIAALGPNVPDLRDQFVRGWSATKAALTAETASTAAPSGGPPTSAVSLAVTGSTNTTGNHHHVAAPEGEDLGGGSGNITLTTSGGQAGWAHNTSDAGDHSHTVTGTATGTVTVDTGWDAETRPENTRLVFAIYIG